MSTITIRHGDPPLSCQHYHVNPETGCCTECSEQMTGVTVEPDTIISAPNALACTNPACKEALDNDTYDENDPPPGCTNPNGTYIPGPETIIVIGYRYTYECARCATGGTLTCGQPIVLPCGQAHFAYVAAPKEVRT